MKIINYNSNNELEMLVIIEYIIFKILSCLLLIYNKCFHKRTALYLL